MLETIPHDNAIIELRLARPPVNAIDPALTRALRDAIAAAPANGASGIVLSGRPGMFSGGLDVPALLPLDRPALHAFMLDFFGLCAAIAASEVPMVAAITGHSPAGGAVLSIFCDFRVMARSVDPAKPFRIGLNEVQVGLSVPACIQAGLQRLVGPYRAERLMAAGAMLESEQALAVGFVDELAAIDDVVPRSLEWLRRLLALPRRAMRETRRLARRDLVAGVGGPDSWMTDQFADAWFGEETQAVLQALVARLKK